MDQQKNYAELILPWTRHFDSNYNQEYFFNRTTGES